MKNLRFAKVAISSLCLFGILASNSAISQFSTDTTSTDPDSRKSLRIRINLQSTFRISSADDLHLYIDDRNRDYSIIEKICIQGSKDDKYKITAHAQKGRDLALINENGEKLPFMMFFYEDLDKYVGEQIHADQAGKEYTIHETKEDCEGEESSALHFIFPKEELQKAKGGSYTADLVVAIGSG